MTTGGSRLPNIQWLCDHIHQQSLAEIILLALCLPSPHYHWENGLSAQPEPLEVWIDHLNPLETAPGKGKKNL